MSEEFKPYIPASENRIEISTVSVLLGIAMAIVFGTANAYLGLRMGTTVSASIPAAVISMFIIRIILHRSSILENNIVQTVASAGESVAAGAIFTLPVLYLWAHEGIIKAPSIATITVISLCGGVLGILFMIPLREMLIVREHKTLPYPEGSACAEVLIAGDSKTSNAKPLFIGVIYSMLIQILSGLIKIVPDRISYSIKSLHTEYSLTTSSAFVAVGYICGLRVAACMLAGAVLGWFVMIPAISLFGAETILSPATVKISQLYAQGGASAIWSNYIRYIGAGAVSAAGILSLAKNTPVILSTFGKSLKQIKNQKSSSVLRTEQQLSTKTIILSVLSIVVLLLILPNIPLSFVGVSLVVVFGFFFTCVSSRMVGLIGATNNPCSSMTIATIIFSAALLKFTAPSEISAMLSAITIAGIICTIVAIAGDTSQDLKTGYIVGATPKKQQMAEIVGVIATALCMSGILALMDKAWGFGSVQLPAPQATMMKMVLEGIVKGNLPWNLVLIGAFITVAVELLGIPSLTVAMGLYLPFSLSSTIMLGGLARWFAERKTQKNDEDNSAAADNPGILYSSGLIAGEGLFGVLLAIFAVTGIDKACDISSVCNLGIIGAAVLVLITVVSLIHFAIKK